MKHSGVPRTPHLVQFRPWQTFFATCSSRGSTSSLPLPLPLPSFSAPSLSLQPCVYPHLSLSFWPRLHISVALFYRDSSTFSSLPGFSFVLYVYVGLYLSLQQSLRTTAHVNTRKREKGEEGERKGISFSCFGFLTPRRRASVGPRRPPRKDGRTERDRARNLFSCRKREAEKMPPTRRAP